MLSATFSVVIDAGHGPGTNDPDGSAHGDWQERDVILAVVAEARKALGLMGVSVLVLDSGPYRERQRHELVTTANLWLSIHCDKQDTRWTPYALALALPHSQDAAGRLVSVYAKAVGLRFKVGEPDVVDPKLGYKPWPKGRDLIQHVPEHVPAVLLELGSLAHAECDGLWTDAHRTGQAVADAVRAVLI